MVVKTKLAGKNPFPKNKRRIIGNNHRIIGYRSTPAMRRKQMRNKQRLEHLATVARMTLRGLTQTEIAAQLGYTQPKINSDIHLLRQKWKAFALRDTSIMQARELAKIQEVEKEFWVEWERSKQPKQITSTKRTNSNEDQGRTEAAVRNEEQTGDPRYLQGVLSCIEKRCQLLGLDAPLKIAPTDPTGTKEYHALTDDERRARILELFNRRGQGTLGRAPDLVGETIPEDAGGAELEELPDASLEDCGAEPSVPE